jgi:hypothetical protein
MSDAPVAPESPQSLLAQMERMLAALNADLVQLDADLQPAAPQHEARQDEARQEGEPFTPEAGRA